MIDSLTAGLIKCVTLTIFSGHLHALEPAGKYEKSHKRTDSMRAATNAMQCALSHFLPYIFEYVRGATTTTLRLSPPL